MTHSQRPRLFRTNKDITSTSILNWQLGERDRVKAFHKIALGYSSSTRYLLNSILGEQSNIVRDSLIFPVLNNFHHSIELFEKVILMMLCKLCGEQETYPTTHDINQLYKKMLEKARHYDLGYFAYLTDETKILRTYFDQLSVHVDLRTQLDFTRYSEDRGQDAHFYSKSKELISLDLAVLGLIVQEASDALENLFNGLFESYSNQVNRSK